MRKKRIATLYSREGLSCATTPRNRRLISTVPLESLLRSPDSVWFLSFPPERQQMAPGASGSADRNSTHIEEDSQGGQEELDLAEGMNDYARLGSGSEQQQQHQQGHLAPRSPVESSEGAEKESRSRQGTSDGGRDGHHQSDGETGGGHGERTAAETRRQEHWKNDPASAEAVGGMTRQPRGYREHDGSAENGECADTLGALQVAPSSLLGPVLLGGHSCSSKLYKIHLLNPHSSGWALPFPPLTPCLMLRPQRRESSRSRTGLR